MDSFITWENLIHVVDDSGKRTLCGHNKPRRAVLHNDPTTAPICHDCLQKASPHIERWNATNEAKRYEPIVKPYKPVGIAAKHCVKPLEGQAEMF